MSMQSKKKRDQKKKKQKKKSSLKSAGFSKNQREEHMDVLQNIEFTLITAYRKDKTVDDFVLGNSLRELIYNKTIDDSRSNAIADRLREVREMRSDISDKIWIKALHTIMESIHLHSALNPGSRGYIHFISEFIPG